MTAGKDKESEILRLQGLKAIFLGQYKALEEPLNYAQNDFESDLIKEQRALLVASIKEIVNTLEELEA